MRPYPAYALATRGMGTDVGYQGREGIGVRLAGPHSLYPALQKRVCRYRGLARAAYGTANKYLKAAY